MSSLYTDYFSLCLHKLNDPAKAFVILEQARGRSLRIRSVDAGQSQHRLEEKIEKILLRNMKNPSLVCKGGCGKRTTRRSIAEFKGKISI